MCSYIVYLFVCYDFYIVISHHRCYHYHYHYLYCHLHNYESDITTTITHYNVTVPNRINKRFETKWIELIWIKRHHTISMREPLYSQTKDKIGSPGRNE